MVSAAIILDLAAQGTWNLDKPLAEIADFGSEEMKKDPRYAKLTARMVLAQCSGLPNWFSGCDLHVMSSIHMSNLTLSDYKNSYIFTDQDTLFYVDKTGKANEVDIADMNGFKENINSIPTDDQNPNKIYLTAQQLIDFITLNGGDTRFIPDQAKTFIAEPGAHFTYSGVAYEWVKEALEKTLGKTWGELAQDFFDKAKMRHSTFQLPKNTHLKDSMIARGHTGDGVPASLYREEYFKEVPAASLLTTPEDYVRFLQYSYSRPPLNDPKVPSLRDLFSSHTTLDPIAYPKTPEAHEKITWGLGMGVFKDGEREIAFHWGNNPNSHAFCAMDITTGNAVACFVNSENGPNVFQTLSENIVGDMQPVFELLSQYCNFNSVVKSESPEALQEFFSEKTGNRELERDQVHTAQSNLSARDDASSIAVLTRGFGFISQSVVAQRAQLDMAAADSVDQKHDTTPSPGK